jgi:hypothetical protein
MDKQHAQTPWELLKELVSKFDGRESDGHALRWVKKAPSTMEADMLRLNDVAALLEEARPSSYAVKFCSPHKPPNAPPAEIWKLHPRSPGPGNEIVWYVYKLEKELPGAALAKAIANRLAEYHLAFEEAVRF